MSRFPVEEKKSNVMSKKILHLVNGIRKISYKYAPVRDTYVFVYRIGCSIALSVGSSCSTCTRHHILRLVNRNAAGDKLRPLRHEKIP